MVKMTLEGYVFGNTYLQAADNLNFRGVTSAEIVVHPLGKVERVNSDGYKCFWYEYGVNVKEIKRRYGRPALLQTKIVSGLVAGLGTGRHRRMDHGDALTRAYGIMEELTKSGIEAKVIELKPKEKIKLNLEWCGSPQAETRPDL